MNEPDSTPDERPSEASNTAGAEWASLAASLGARKPSQPARSGPSAGGGGRMPVGVLGLSALAFVLALIAIAVTGMLWWQYRAFYVSLDQNDTAASAALERVRAEQRMLADKLSDLGKSVDTLRQTDSSINQRVDALPSRFADLERRLDAVQGGSFAARSDLLRSEAEYYLTVANTQLSLAGNWDNAIKALELADGRLAELANPRFAPVRETIAGELQALRGVRLPDTEGLVFSLGRLAGRVEQLAMRKEAPTNYPDGAGAEEGAEPGLGRLWLAIKRTLLGLVRVERRESPVPQALSAAEREFGRRRLELELELARVAALRGQAQAFQSALAESTAILRSDFDVDSADVDGALALLREMQGVEIAPKRPDLSESLNELRNVSAGDR